LLAHGVGDELEAEVHAAGGGDVGGLVLGGVKGAEFGVGGVAVVAMAVATVSVASAGFGGFGDLRLEI
jgi:hypothetical protein